MGKYTTSAGGAVTAPDRATADRLAAQYGLGRIVGEAVLCQPKPRPTIRWGVAGLDYAGAVNEITPVSAPQARTALADDGEGLALVVWRAGAWRSPTASDFKSLAI